MTFSLDGEEKNAAESPYKAEADPMVQRPGLLEMRRPPDLSLHRLPDALGIAFGANIPAPAEHFLLLSGTPKTYSKTAESGNNASTPPAALVARQSIPPR